MDLQKDMSFEGVLLFSYVKDFTKSVCGSDFKRQFELNWQLIGVELGDPTASLCLTTWFCLIHCPAVALGHLVHSFNSPEQQKTDLRREEVGMSD